MRKLKIIILSLVGVLIVPLILNRMIYSHGPFFVYGNGDTWLSFWGNYLGGILSAIVAYIVANSQIKKQLRLDMAKEQFNKRVNQLPALIRIKLELNKYIKELEEVKHYREKTIEKNGGVMKYPNEVKDESELEGISIHKLNTIHYYMATPEESSLSYLEKIDEIDLHIDLIECFNFYKEFVHLMNYNLENALAKRRLLEKQIEELKMSGDLNEMNIINNQVLNIFMEMNKVRLSKEVIWKTLYEEDKVNFLKSVLVRLNKEIELVRKMKQSGDLSGFKKVS